MGEDNGRRLDIDWLRTIGGALAAVSSAVLLSTLGAAGTLIGAALGSVIATVGGAVYTQGLSTSRQQLARAQSAARLHVGVAQAELRRAKRQQGGAEADDVRSTAAAGDEHLTEAEERLDEARDELDSLSAEPAGAGWRDRLRALPWGRLALPAAGLFAATLLAITAFELTTGDSVSEITGGTDGSGGTTIGQLGGGGDRPDKDTEKDGPVDERDPADRPSGDPSTRSTPTAEPDEEPTVAPTAEPTSTPPPELPSETAEPSVTATQ